MSGSQRIGWSPKEILWLRAALTLPGYDCICALDDISSMSGRTINAVRAKAKDLEGEKQSQERAVDNRRILVPAAAVKPVTGPSLAPIKPITTEQRMGGK